MIFNLPLDLQKEILSKVPLKSLKQLRSTCKGWYHHTLFKDPIFIKKLGLDQTSKQYLALWLNDSVYSMSYCKGLTHIGIYLPYTSLAYQVSQTFHCDGILLCIINYNSFMAWNPFSGQTLWIQRPRTPLIGYQFYALGYNNKNLFHSYKLLRFIHYQALEIYDFRTELWRNVNVSPDGYVESRGVSLRGDTYWISKRRHVNEFFLLKFDFSTETFVNMHLPIPEAALMDVKSLSVVREEHLSLFYQNANTLKIEVWMTNEIQTRFVSWRKFFTVDCFCLFPSPLSFFIDEEKKVAICSYKYMNSNRLYMVGYKEPSGFYYPIPEYVIGSVFGYVPLISLNPATQLLPSHFFVY